MNNRNEYEATATKPRVAKTGTIGAGVGNDQR